MKSQGGKSKSKETFLYLKIFIVKFDKLLKLEK